MSIGNQPSLTNNVASKTISVTATTGQTLFNITGGYRINQLSVYRNGTRLVDSQDYTARDGATVTLASPASSTDVLEFQVFDDFRVADALNVNSGGTVNGDVTIVSAATTALLVDGNTRVTGILTVGNSSITLDGSSNQISVGTGITISSTGITGSASTVTNASTSYGLSGVPDIEIRNITGVAATFTGNVSIAGTLTYEDVTNVDSIGLVTARSGVVLTGGDLTLGTGVTASGATANTFTVSTNGAQRLLIEADGDINIDSGGVFYNATNNRLGIGTTTPLELLTVWGGNILTDANDRKIGYKVTGSANAGYLIPYDTSGNTQLVNERGTGNLVFKTADTERLRLTSDGELRIQSTVTTPETKYFRFYRLSTGNAYIGCSIGGAGNGQPTELFFGTNSAGVGPQERARIDSSGRLLVGTSSSRLFGGASERQVLIESTTGTGLGILRNSNDDISGILTLGKTRGTSNGSSTIVQNNDYLGIINFVGADGVDAGTYGAHILCHVDGTPGANDMPGRLVFSTNPGAPATGPTTRLVIPSTSETNLVIYGGTGSANGESRIVYQVSGTSGYAPELVGYAQQVAAGARIGSLRFYTSTQQDSGRKVNLELRGLGPGGAGDRSVHFPNIKTTASAANAFLDSGNSNSILRSTSSLRYKADIEDLDSARADAILSFRPVWYRSTSTSDRNDWSWYGLIAEEVAAIEPRLVHWTYLDDAYDITYETVENEDGTTVEVEKARTLKPDAEQVPDGVQYDRLTVLLLDVVQRQQKAIETLEAKVAALEAQ